ncbi:carboxylesterase family protein [Gilvimarinus agarilyticus]|uniref:carboxylesterase/lipase family protein n=1 Tax=Gilvimarinus sp. 2_MG-2023 TaxID=3062666 RepID=UPI001C0929E2|nr:carboxylesterase family protein [Gilvimarinus sp. 2_MG-2023]MBU2886174.1 carboxylesterase family protein [Gilvimarinus agarilyticus]MDO6570877.1 carboxylesterase family protein [Gilvimarinus sp. 2_MG-2023]
MIFDARNGQVFLCVLVGLLLFLPAALIAQADDIQISSSAGRVKGTMLDNTVVFKGIPFAAPPVGDRRWAVPQPIQNWMGTFNATFDPPACLQQLTPERLTREEAYQYAPQSEDCLYLSVYAPLDAIAEERGKSLPVLFLIHSGGRTAGSMRNMNAQIAEFNRRGIVVVTAQYRLGIFSFFAHPELSAESPHKSSGNYGTMDLVSALQWVRSHIASFGGDPKTITVSGASGGGSAVGALLATPLAKGLFQRAAPFCSNAAINRMHRLRQPTLDQPSAETLGVRFAQSVQAQSLAELRNMPARQLQQRVLSSGVANFDPPTGAGDVVDGWVFPQSIRDLHQSGKRADVPVMLGFNADEVSVFHRARLVDAVPASSDAYVKSIRERYGNISEDFLRLYPSDDLLTSVYHAGRDRVAGYGAETLARYSSKVSSPTYLYYMAHRPPYADEPVAGVNVTKGVAHCADANYFYGRNLHAEIGETGITAADQELSQLMFNYLVNFIKTGKPNQDGLPGWPSYDTGAQGYMRFEHGVAQPSNNLLPGMWELYEKIRLRDDASGQFRSWLGGWASDSLLRRSRAAGAVIE